MKKKRADLKGNSPFTKTQVYLLLVSMAVVAVLALVFGGMAGIGKAPVKEGAEVAKLPVPAKELTGAETEPIIKKLKPDEPIEPAETGKPAGDSLKIVEDKKVINLTFAPETAELPEEVSNAPVKSIGAQPSKSVLTVSDKIVHGEKEKEKVKRTLAQVADAVSAVSAKLAAKVIKPHVGAGIKVKKKPQSTAGKKKPKKGEPPKPKYTVQIKTFPTEEPAKAMASNLKKKGYAAYVNKMVRPRSTWYRVRVGGYPTVEEASKTAEKLKKKENLSAARPDRFVGP
jgi:cell division protein FtsN